MRTLSLISLGVLSLACSSNALRGGDGGAGTGGAGTGGAGDGSAGTGGVDAAVPPKQVVIDVLPFPNRDVDMLFVIDNSSGMAKLQDRFIQGFVTFVDVLRGLPGGLPNIHLAVVSSDIGAGAYDIGDIPNCRHGGDQGIFQVKPLGRTCNAGSLNVGEHFIANVNGQANFTGSLEATFGCIAALGETGCGFEHQLGSMLRALGADGAGPAPLENANFLRPNAYLAITILTNEDDCSAPINSTFFDPTSRYVADPLGPLTSFRCAEYGHLCGGMKPPRRMAADLSGTCTSAEDGVLLRVRDVADSLKALKPGQPDKVLVSVIAGPPSAYKVHLEQPTLTDDPSQWPWLDRSCSLDGDGTFATPGIRVKELTDAFGANGVFQGACSTSFAPALQRIAEQIGTKAAGIPCLDGVADANPDAPGFQPSCEVVDRFFGPSTSPVRSCADTGAVAPCWELGTPTASCPTGPVKIRRDTQDPALAWTRFTCKG